MIRQSAPAATFCARRGGLAERIGAVDELPGADAQPARVQSRDELRRELLPDVRRVGALDVDRRHARRARARGDRVEVAAIGLRQLPDPHAVAAHRRRAACRRRWRTAGRGARRADDDDVARVGAPAGAIADGHGDAAERGAGRHARRPAGARRGAASSPARRAASETSRACRGTRPRPRSWIWRPRRDAHGLAAGRRRGRHAAQAGQARGGRAGLRRGRAEQRQQRDQRAEGGGRASDHHLYEPAGVTEVASHRRTSRCAAWRAANAAGGCYQR